MLVQLVDLPCVEEEVVVVTEEGEDLIPDEYETAINCVFVQFVRRKEPLSFQLTHFLIQVLLSPITQLKLHLLFIKFINLINLYLKVKVTNQK